MAIFSLLAALIGLGSLGQAAPDESDIPASIRFHRVLAPENRIQQWPLAKDKYLPINAREFDDLVAASQSDKNLPTATLTSAHYTARLEGDVLVGRASVDIMRIGSRPVALSWQPCNLAMKNIVWKSDDDKHRKESPAVLGYGGNGGLQVIVEQSGQLTFHWSLVGRRDSNDVLTFLGEMPIASAAQWEFDLPDELTPIVNHGVIVGNRPIDDAMRRWQIELGGHHRVQLRLVSGDMTRRGPEVAMLRESRTYELSPHGIELSSQWKLQVYNKPLSRITLLLDPGLQLVSARSGDTLLSWTIESPPNEPTTRIALDLPESIRNGNQTIRLDAMGTTILDRPWKLPSIRAQELLWQEGSLTMLVPEPLAINRITPLGCAQTATGPLSTPRLGESMQFQAFEPSATVETLLSLRPTSPATSKNAASNDTPPKQTTTDTNTKRQAIAAPPATTERRAWAWNGTLESRYPTNGAAIHRATYQLQNTGRQHLRLTLPPEVFRKNIRGVWINQQPIAWRWIESDASHCLTVELPPSLNNPHLTLEWTASAAPLGIAGSVAPPLPELDLPVLACQWIVGLPHGYRLTSSAVASALPSQDSVDDQSWSTASLEVLPKSPVRLNYVHIGSLAWIGVLVFFSTIALGYRWVVDRSLLLAELSGVAVFIAILLPDICTLPMLGSALGLLACAVGGWIQKKLPPSPPPANRTAAAAPLSSTIAKIHPVGLLFFAALLVTQAARAESPMYQVWIPIDDAKKPVGDKLYLPEPLYRALQRRATSTGDLPSWMISQASYRGTLGIDSDTGRFRLNGLRARYDLNVSGRYTQVQLPLRTKEANVASDGVRLDGRAIPVHWHPGSGFLTFEVTDPGKYRLDIDMHPALQHGSEANGAPLFRWLSLQNMAQQWVKPFRPVGPDAETPDESDEPYMGIDLSIPPVAGAQFELFLPDHAPSIDVPSAGGRSRVEKNPSRLVADLGPTDRLTVRWNQGLVPAKVHPVVSADQLVWLTIQPGSLMITARFHLRVREGQLRQVQMAVDPQLRLLPLSGNDPPTVQIGQDAGPLRTITFRWPKPIADAQSLEVTFLLSEAAGIGNFRLPQIELLDIPNVKRWVGVSVVPTLDFKERNTSGMKSVRVGEFLQAWKDADPQGTTEDASTVADPSANISISLGTPQRAYRASSATSDWTIATQSHAPRNEADQTLSLGCDRDRLHLRFDALISTTSGYLFQHRLKMPNSWTIDRVSLFDANVERAGRWTRNEDGTVTIFLTVAVSGKQKLQVDGSMAMTPNTAWSMPQVRLEQCEILSSTVQFYERPGIQWLLNGVRPGGNVGRALRGSVDPELGRWIAGAAEEDVRSLTLIVIPKNNRMASPTPSTSNVADAKTIVEPADTPKDLPERIGMARAVEITLAWRTDGVCYGTAAFDLEPDGADACPFTLPQGYQWIDVSINDLPVAPAKVGDRTWRVPLADPQKRQRLKIAFRGVLPEIGQSATCPFRAPTLASWPIRKTQWTVIGPPAWIDPPNENNVRIENVASIFPETQPTMQGAFSGACDSWTLDCRLADSNRSSSRWLWIAGWLAAGTVATVRVRRWNRKKRNSRKLNGGGN